VKLAGAQEGPTTKLGVAVLDKASGTVSYNGKPLELEKDTVEVASGVFIMAIKRGDKWAIRAWDSQAPTLTGFRGIDWFPYSSAARVEAKWVPYAEPKKVQIPNILGDLEDNVAIGLAEFEWEGTVQQLEPVVEDDALFLMFRDHTSTTGATYGSGRFLSVDMPSADGKVVLDFNRSRNPPCAFTAFATCQIPPRNNWLKVSIEAGSRKHGGH